MQFGHKVEVHAIHARYQCGRQEYNAHDGENFDDFVLLDIDQTKECVLQIFEAVERKARVFEKRIDVLDDDGQFVFTSVGNISLLSILEQTRCLSTMFSRINIVFSCNSLMAISMSSLTSSFFN